jgi:HSP20 family protein
VTLPSDIEPDNVNADLHDGVLNIRVPKTATSAPRRIDVSRS